MGVGLGASGSGRLGHLDASLCCQSPLKEPSAFDLFFRFAISTHRRWDPSPPPFSGVRNWPAPPFNHVLLWYKALSWPVSCIQNRLVLSPRRLPPSTTGTVTACLKQPEPAGSANSTSFYLEFDFHHLIRPSIPFLTSSSGSAYRGSRHNLSRASGTGRLCLLSRTSRSAWLRSTLLASLMISVVTHSTSRQSEIPPAVSMSLSIAPSAKSIFLSGRPSERYKFRCKVKAVGKDPDEVSRLRMSLLYNANTFFDFTARVFLLEPPFQNLDIFIPRPFFQRRSCLQSLTPTAAIWNSNPPSWRPGGLLTP